MRLRELPLLQQLSDKVVEIKKARNFRQTVEKSLKWHHEEKDPEDAKFTTPPTDEDIQIQSIWVTEAYPPSLINDLLDSLRKHGWDRTDHNLPGDVNLIDWIKGSRGTGSSSSWRNAGILLRTRDTRFPLSDNTKRTKLPEVVDYAYLSIRNVTASLTLVTANFILKPKYSSSLNDILSTDYKTKVEHYRSRVRHSRRAAYVGVEEQKKRQIKEMMTKIHQELYGWFRHELPGYYSINTLNSFSTVDFITSSKYQYLKKDERVRRDSYFGALFGSNSEIWNCKQVEGLELRVPFSIREKTNLIIFGNIKKLSNGSKGYGDGLVGKIHDYFDATAGLLAVNELLASYEKGLSAIRDKASSKNKSAKKTLDNLAYIREEFLAISTDVKVVSRELLQTIKPAKRYYDDDKLVFSPPSYLPDTYPDYIEGIRQRDELRIDQLSMLEEHVRDAVVSGGNIASAISNLRIQRYVFWLTIAAAVLAAISVRSFIGDTFNSIWNWLSAVYTSTTGLF